MSQVSDVRSDALVDQGWSGDRAYQVRSLDEAAQHVTSLTNRVDRLEKEVRYMADLFDTYFDTPLWKRILFVIDGWPMGGIIGHGPAWRPWRRWWTS